MLVEEFTGRSMRSLIAVERDLLRQSALALERPAEKRFGCRDVSLGAEQEIHSLSLFVDSAVKISPLAFNLHVGFVNPPGCADPAGETVPPLFEFRNIARYPAHDCGVSQGNSALSHHLHKISKTELEPEIPAQAEDNDVPVELAALEKIIHAQHPSSLPPNSPKVSSRGICSAFAGCTRAPEGAENGPLAPEHDAVAVARLGDKFRLGEHRIMCGDATDPAVVARLMDGDSPARLVLTDEPYNVAIARNVTRGVHREFLMASGEMSDAEFRAFNDNWMSATLPWLCDGGVFGTFIDWRGYPTVFAAASTLALNPVNLIVWAKTNAGMGSLYRSQHELLPLFKKGDSPHINNIELGRKGRWRSNVWTYPGASSFGSDARRGLEDHPTVKPIAMLVDALHDLTNRGDIVLDPFLGSGSTLMAAESTDRCCRGVELDPLYIDVILRRYENETGESAVLEETGETFDELREKRLNPARRRRRPIC